MTNRLIDANWTVIDTSTGEVINSAWHSEGDDNDSLIQEAVVLSNLAGLIGDRLNTIRLEMKIRLQGDGATEYVGSYGAAILKASPSYDANVLDMLLELLPEKELTDAGALTLAHEKTVDVERKWNMTRLRKFGRRGQAIRDVFDAARTEGGHRVVFTADD